MTAAQLGRTHSHGIVRFNPTRSLLSGAGETFHFVYENAHQGVLSFVEHRLDIIEELSNQLSAFTEVFTEERVGVNLYQLALRVLSTKPYR